MIAEPPELAAEWPDIPIVFDEPEPPPAMPATSPEKPCADIFDRAVMTVDDLRTRAIPARKVLLSPFLREGNLGFIYGTRGHGKTWLSMFIATALASGRAVGAWKADVPVTTLIVDGEVDLDESQDRARLLEASGNNLLLLHHQEMFDQSEGKLALDLALPDQQLEITRLCERKGVRVLILDNLSSLLRGIAENDGDDWEPIAHWLLDLRRRGIAVIIVHHAGRNGQMRGHSRREDPAHWIIKVEKTESSGPDVTAFITTFEKYRKTASEAQPLRWEIKRLSADEIAIGCKEASGVEMFIQHVLEGAERNADIAELMGKPKGTISKMAAKAAAEGRIRIVGGRYKAPE